MAKGTEAMLFPVFIAVAAAGIYIGLQQEHPWVALIYGYLDVITSKWTHPQVLANHNTTNGDWNILYHLGGNGPWIPKVDGPFGDELSVPEGCKIEQVHMVGTTPLLPSSCQMLILFQIARHNERYPTYNTGTRKFRDHIISQVQTLTKLQTW